ncbi:MAG: DUF2207 domain-containing protein, partial [Anaerovoracaceae bacterium]
MSKWNFKRAHASALTLSVIILLFCVFAGMPVAYGADGTMETLGYDVHVQLEEDNTCYITETITVNYLTPHHGIYRNIRYRGVAESSYEGEVFSRNYSNRIQDVTVAGYMTQTYVEGDYFVVQIGSPDFQVDGIHTYTIGYRCIMRDDRISAFDSFYWNLLPFGWQMPIASSQLTVEFPKAIPESQLEIIAGGYGSTETIPFDLSQDGRTLTTQVSNLPEGYGVTVHSVMEEGYFVGEANLNWALWLMLVGLLGAPIFVFVLWLRYGRDPRIVQTVEFYPPEGTTPAEVGYIVDGVVDKKDLVSLIIYLAEKGHLTIEPIEEGQDTLLRRRKDLPEDAPIYLKTFFEGLFLGEEDEVLDEVKISQLKETFYSHYQASLGQLRSHFTSRKENRIYKPSSLVARVVGALFVVVPPVSIIAFGAIYQGMGYMALLAMPVLFFHLLGFGILLRNFDKRDGMKKSARIAGSTLAIILMGVGVLITTGIGFFLELPYYIILLSVISFPVVVLFTILMRRRTKKGAEWMGKILGFKEFIKKAELPRIEKLLEEDPQYFYHVLPYAYVFGLTNQWSKKFESIVMEPPTWVESNYMGSHMFSTIWLGNMLGSTTRAMEQSIIPAASLGDGSKGGFGGSGGGGFSGG